LISWSGTRSPDSVVAAQRMWMGEAVGHAGDGGIAAHKLRETLLRDGAVAAVSRAREADEQHVVVAQRCPNPNANVPDQIAPRATT